MGRHIDLKKLAVVTALSVFVLVSFEWVALHYLVLDLSGYTLLSILTSFMPLIGYVGLFVLLLLENASVPLPAEVFLPLAGYYVFVGRMSLVGVLTVSSISSVLGSIAIFLIASKLGPSRIYWGATKLGVGQNTLAKNEVRLCGRNGPLLLFFSRFVPIFGSLIVLPAGALRMSFSRVALMSLIGSLAATSAYVFLGYAFGPLLFRYNYFISSLVIRYILYAMVAAFALYGAYYAFRMFRQRRAKEMFAKKILKTKSMFGESNHDSEL